MGLQRLSTPVCLNTYSSWTKKIYDTKLKFKACCLIFLTSCQRSNDPSLGTQHAKKIKYRFLMQSRAGNSIVYNAIWDTSILSGILCLCWWLHLSAPTQELMALVLRNLILQTHMCSYTVGLDVWFLVGPFVYFQLHVCEQRRLPIIGRLCYKYHYLMSWLIYCKFTVNRDNFIFANISKFDYLLMQNSGDISSYVRFTQESILHRELKYQQLPFQSQNREIKNTRK